MEQQQTQRQQDPADEALTHEEVTAILNRYGEQQAGEAPPRVSDVAEALQVDRSVVTRLLQDIRSANTEKQLRERLDRLEREHAELRSRAEASEADVSVMFGSGHWTRRRNRQRREVSLVAVVMAAAMASAFAVRGQHLSGSSPAVYLFVAAAFILLMRRRFRP